jgi:hypothetical protein
MIDDMGKTMVPDPDAWVDTAGAAAILGRTRATVYDMVERGVLVRYRIGPHAVFWAAEVREVAAALSRAGRKRSGGRVVSGG